MALIPCPECQKDISDKATTCPQCGLPLAKPSPPRAWKKPALAAGVVAAVVTAGAGMYLLLRPPDYSRLEDLRAEQDALGRKDERVRQRFLDLYRQHSRNAMYAYLWARCVEDPAAQLEVAEQGIRSDKRFAPNYGVAARALARLSRVPQALDYAEKGTVLDPANVQLADRRDVLKSVLDHKLGDQPKPTPGTGVRYRGLFHGYVQSPDRADLQAIERNRAPDAKGPPIDAVRGFSACANPVADACLRVYVPNDPKLARTWPAPAADVSHFRDRHVVAVSGTVVANGKGENILLADSVAPEAP